MTDRNFKVGTEINSVDDIMIGIPRMFRDEFVGVIFEDYRALSLCLAHADTARRAKIEGDWRYETELEAMRAYLK